MNLSFYIAKRYLFSKKSHNAVNVISFISVCGITVATLALICILSMFNGFTDVLTKTFSAFDPQLQITPVAGKVFTPDSLQMERLTQLEGVDFISESLEENALLKNGDRQQPILLKGVSPQFEKLASFDTILIDGQFQLREGDIDYGVIGGGLAMQVNTRAGFLSPVQIYMPKRNVQIQLANPANAFSVSDVYIGGVFALNQAKYDDRLLIVSIDLVRQLLSYQNEVSSLDIKVKEGMSVSTIQKQIKEIMGNEYDVKDRFEQQADLYRMVSVEKWVVFLILIFVAIIAIFNVVGSLSILIIEKKENITILQSLGMHNQSIARIFLLEGWLITFFGSVFGLVIGLAICLIQQYFGVLKLGDGGTFVIDAYPVAVEATDIILVFATVNIIGFLAVIYPVNNLRKQL